MFIACTLKGENLFKEQAENDFKNLRIMSIIYSKKDTKNVYYIFDLINKWRKLEGCIEIACQ